MQGVLYLQSSYSMLKNTIPLESLIKKASENGYDFIALSDEHLHGLLQLYKESEKYNIKPILGLHVTCTHDLDQMTFLIYAKNQKGYENLLKIAFLKSESIPSYETLIEHQEGLIFVSAGREDSITKHILNDQLEQSLKLVEIYQNDLDDFYLGLSLDTFDLEMKVAPQLKMISQKQNIKLLPLHQTSYLNPEDQIAYEALIKIADENNTMPSEAQFHFLDFKALEDMFSDYPGVFKNLSEMVQRIMFKFDPPQFDMPRYETPNHVTSQVYLKSLAQVGLKKRLKQNNITTFNPYVERLNFELSVISKMGYDDYFLIVYDFVKYAKTHDILVGPGRGSAAGSLVSYALGITDIDPITYDLLFERFLNPERMSMPDIDLDFPDDKRDEVIHYVLNKYGKEHMVSIVTFGTFALRSSIRDIARVMKIEPSRVNGIIEAVINDRVDPTDHETVRLLNVAKQIEGLPRHTGTHAAGMILSHQNLLKHIPLHMGGHAFYQSQLEAKDLESLGLLKIDFLGIRNLTIIHEVVKEIQKVDQTFDLRKIPLDDEKAYHVLAHAETQGIFQLESQGMRSTLRKLKPKTFEDIVAILALYRPGPMENIDLYIRRKEGEAYQDLHPVLTPILKSTYGIIVYQEQVMKIAQDFAGYSLAEADLLRRGISKKDRYILETEKQNFVQKAVEKGHDKPKAIELYDYIVRFADYGFNRSHSVAYGLIAYQMAYLKANYFPIFMVALLNSVIGNEALTHSYFSELKTHKIKLLKPDINASTDVYIYSPKGILMPLLSVKSIGRQAVQKLLLIREDGLFEKYLDFKLRIKKELNERNIELLIHSGALDCFGLNHKTMIENKDIDYAGYEHYVKDFKLKTFKEYDMLDKAEFEKEALGFNLTYHPLMAYEALIKEKKLSTLEDAQKTSDVIEVLAYIRKTKVIKTKNNQSMAFITLDDGNQTLDVTIFSNDYEQLKQQLDKEVAIFKIKKNIFKDKETFVFIAMKKV